MPPLEVYDKPPADTILYADSFPLTTVPVPLGNFRCREVLVQADPANAGNTLVGGSGKQTVVLTPGASVSLTVPNTGILYARSATGTGAANVLAVA
jgi:hypothetical protein